MSAPDPQEERLHERVARLEEAVESLRRRVEALHEVQERAIQKRQAPARAAPPAGKKSSQKQKRSWLALDWDSENWLSRIGIALTLFGLAFFFNFSVEQGWLTPAVQVGLGALLGAVLLILGLRIREQRARLGQILLGGSGAVFYATVFAAYQLYGLIAYPLAFAGMVLVTVGTFFLAVRQDDAALSVVGVLGGLGTPFLLYTEAGSLPGLVGYTCLILAGAGAIYLWRGWRTLLYTSVVGGWLTLGFALLQVKGFFSRSGLSPDATVLAGSLWGREALQLGVLFAWLVFWSVPTLREVLAAWHPERWEQRRAARAEASSLIGAFLFRPPAHTLAFSSPLIALAFSRQLWAAGDAFWGGVALAGCLVYIGAYAALRRTGLKSLAQAHILVAAVLLAYGSSALLGGDTFLLALAAEGAAFHLLSRTLDDRSLRLTGHVFFVVAGLAVAVRIAFSVAEAPVFVNAGALSEAGAIALGAGIAAVLGREKTRRAYRFVAHLLALGWLWHELAWLPDGQAYVTIAWGLYAVALLAMGLRTGSTFVRIVALGTILAVVAKLFLVDLAELSALWRVLLFLGFGGLFLLLSYFLGEGEWVRGRAEE